jgi:hemerythrin
MNPLFSEKLDAPELSFSNEIAEWSSALHIGIGIIDDQHTQLITMLHKLNQEVHEYLERKVDNRILAKIIEEASIHFETEEMMMQDHDYPNKKDHKERHIDLLQTVENYINNYKENTHASNADLIAFLKYWLIQHITKDDKALGEFLVAKGLS